MTTPSDESTAPEHPMDTPVPTTASPMPTYVISVVFLLVAVLFVMASPLDWYGAFKTIHVVFAVIWIGGGFLLTVLAFIAELERDPQGKAIVANQASKLAMRVFTPRQNMPESQRLNIALFMKSSATPMPRSVTVDVPGIMF